MNGLIEGVDMSKIVWVPQAASGLIDVSNEAPAILYLTPRPFCTRVVPVLKVSQVRSPDSQVWPGSSDQVLQSKGGLMLGGGSQSNELRIDSNVTPDEISVSFSASGYITR